MKGLAPLFLGLFGTFMFSWVGLTVVPNAQIGRLDPQSLDEDTDIYPMPQSGMAERGRQIYTANGCTYCHSRWVRADYAGSDLERKWGVRRSAPRDYVFERPVLLGKMRTGPDLSNIGQRAPLEDDNAAAAAGSPAPGGAAVAPQGAAVSSPPATANVAAGQPPTSSPGPAGGSSPAVGGSPSPGASPATAVAQNQPAAAGASPAASPAASGSPAAAGGPAATAQAPSAGSSLGSENKPGEAPMYSAAWHHKHLYSPRSVTLDSIMPAYRFLYQKRPITGQPSADALKLAGKDAPPEGWEIVPTYDAKCLVAFLISSNQSHPLNEAKSGGAAAVPPAASPAGSPAAPVK